MLTTLGYEIGIMVSIAIWFACMARLKRRAVAYWAVVGAVSFYVPLFLFYHFIVPGLFGSITVDSPLILSFGVPTLGYALGLVSSYFARGRLLKLQAESIESILSALKDRNPEVRRKAVQALYHTNDPGAAEPLFVALRDDDYEVRVNAANAFYYMKDPRSVEPLIGALKDVNGDVRRVASDTLGILHDIRAVKPLIPILNDPDPNIHDAAMRALKRITGQDFGRDQLKWNEWAGMKKED